MSASLTDLKPILKLFVREKKRGLLLGAVMSATTAAAGVALLGLSGWFITATAIAGTAAATAITFDVFAPSAGIRLLAIGRTASRYGERLTTHDATLSVLAALRERLFRGWAKAGAARDLARRPARLLFRLTGDIDALDSLYLRVLVPAGVAILAALATGIALGLMHPLFGLSAALLLFAAGLGIPLCAGRLAAAHARRRAYGIEALRARTIDLVAAQSDLLMAGRIEAQATAISAADRYAADADDRLNRIESIVTLGFGAASTFLLTGALLAVSALAGAGTITAPVAALGILIAFAAVEPFGALRRGALELGRTLLAAKRIGPRLADEQPAGRHAAPSTEFAIELAGVSAAYDAAATPVLVDINLTLKAGEKLALIGASGAGKSTLLALLAGEIAPLHGMIANDAATLMTQCTELFQDTVGGNLRLAHPRATVDDLKAALAAAGLLADIVALPANLGTRLGEGGMGLSGGQARRLALARLFLRDTRLWLLDEPTEGLDRATARDVMARLSEKADGRTLVIATHIRREAEITDVIATLDGGRIAGISRRGETAFEDALNRLRPD
ncbi:amino acid ABC transporter ATP-binding/permease protein [Rhizobium metallidurans]|uniref:ATP-binding cassette subfamily C protein CydC n=1 Tax=Rhizobium metallidurans TaxID=1265931 RepID=A0A7W6CSG8_9HYPH|nr:ATP-binding cassette domain-containing protein [Rhizobium metallidurans]MBB3963559.1 ATP-binding cassette subfamily C protein CydC [Rhizobium metallidurans]